MESCIHKGLVVEMDSTPGYAKVWVPTGNCTVPNGFSEYLYQNSGGNLYGEDLLKAKGTSYRCKIATSLCGGAWWSADLTKGVSIFDDYDKSTAYDYRLLPNYQTHGNNGSLATYTLPTDNPAATGAISNSTLSVAGGNTTTLLGTMPKGDFPYLEPNQWVLVAFLHSSSNPVVFASLHSDEAWNVIQKH